jgi:ABC-2 type transport system ATP-binding protein
MVGVDWPTCRALGRAALPCGWGMTMRDEVIGRVMQAEAFIGDALLLDALRIAQDFARDFAPDLREAALRLRQRYDAASRFGLGRIAEQLDQAEIRAQALDLVYDGARSFLARSATRVRTREAAHPDVVVAVEGLSKSFDRSTYALRDVSLELRAGEIMGVVGRNGAGKTTLMRCLIGELSADVGSLSYPAISEKLDWGKIKQAIGYVPQTAERWHGSLRANLNFVAAAYHNKARDNKKLIDWVMARYDLGRYQYATWEQISGGYKTRFELARAMLSRPKLLVLDEPLAFLDVIARQRFLQDLRSIARSFAEPTAVVITSQHIYDVEAIADRMVLIEDGECTFSGSLEELEANARERSLEIVTKAPRRDVEIVLESFGLRHIEVAVDGFIVALPRAVNVGEVFTSLAVTFGKDFAGLRDITGSSRHLLTDLQT